MSENELDALRERVATLEALMNEAAVRIERMRDRIDVLENDIEILQLRGRDQ